VFLDFFLQPSIKVSVDLAIKPDKFIKGKIPRPYNFIDKFLFYTKAL
jgi:hypothetical protein